MNTDFLPTFINFLATALQLLILARVLMSWVSPHPKSAAGRFLVEVTEPILWPFQRILPPLGGFDLSPILALLTIQLLQTLLLGVLAG